MVRFPDQVRLREFRERLGLTQDQLADRLSTLVWEVEHERRNSDREMVRKWERGEKRPDPAYRRLLCLLYRATEEQLGLRPAVAGGEMLLRRLRDPHLAAQLDDPYEERLRAA